MSEEPESINIDSEAKLLPKYNDSDVELMKLFNDYPDLSSELKNELINKGFTMNKLLLLSFDDIKLSGNFPDRLAGDLLLFEKALNEYKSNMDKSVNNNDISTAKPEIDVDNHKSYLLGATKAGELQLQSKTAEQGLLTSTFQALASEEDFGYVMWILVWVTVFIVAITANISVSIKVFVGCILIFMVSFWLRYHYEIPILKSAALSLAMIPMTSIAVAIAIGFGVGMLGFSYPIIASKLFLKKPKTNEAYSDNNKTHLHVLTAVVTNRDKRFFIVWFIMLVYTVIVVVLSIKGYGLNNSYKNVLRDGKYCRRCIDYCQIDSFEDVNDYYRCYYDCWCNGRCSFEGNEYQEFCKPRIKAISYQAMWMIIGFVFGFNYFIIMYGLHKYANMKITKSVVFGFPMLLMMSGLAIPVTIVAGIITCIIVLTR